MAELNIGNGFYNSYVELEDADEYLAADMKRYSDWSAGSDDNRKRALVTATRYLSGLNWSSAPEYATAAQAVKDATSLLAADILGKPDLGDDSSTGSNVSSVKAGSAQVTFFRPSPGEQLPSHILRLIGDLLDGEWTWSEGGAAYGSDDCQTSRFDTTDYALTRGYN